MKTPSKNIVIVSCIFLITMFAVFFINSLTTELNRYNKSLICEWRVVSVNVWVKNDYSSWKTPDDHYVCNQTVQFTWFMQIVPKDVWYDINLQWPKKVCDSKLGYTIWWYCYENSFRIIKIEWLRTLFNWIFLILTSITLYLTYKEKK